MRASAAITTRRLRLRPFVSADAEALYEFMRDPQAMRHTYIASSLQECADRLYAYEQLRSALGYAPWVVQTQEDARVIGWGGLSIDLQEPEWGLEVSYAFDPAFWGKGYATELVRHSLAFAFAALSAPVVHAFAMPSNGASIRVLEKSGFAMLRYEPALQRNHYLVAAPGEA